MAGGDEAVATAAAHARRPVGLGREAELLEASVGRGSILVRTRRTHGATRVDGWLARRSYPSCRIPAEELARSRTATVSVIVPAKEVAGTIAGVVDELVGLREAGLVDEVLVVDAASADGTAAIARDHGADVAQEDALRADLGPARGKGDAMWRGLAATSGEIVVYVDADSEVFSPGFVTSLVAPMFADETLALVKGSFRRPFRVGGTVLPTGGGRVTELLARPLLNLHRPELAGFAQPLAGEIAARRSLLRAPAVPGRLRRGDRDAARRPRARRHRRAGAGRPRRAAEPPSVADALRPWHSPCSSRRSGASASSTTTPPRWPSCCSPFADAGVRRIDVQERLPWYAE